MLYAPAKFDLGENVEEFFSIEFSSFFSSTEISSVAATLSSGVGKFSKSGGNTSGSFFCTKNSSAELDFSPVNPLLTESKVLHEGIINITIII